MGSTIEREILGETIKFVIDSNGRFQWVGAEEGEAVSAPSLQEAIDAATAILKRRLVQGRVPVEVSIVGIREGDPQKNWGSDAYTRDELGVLDFTLRGYNPRTRTLTVTTSAGEKTKVDKGYFGTQVVGRLTPAEREEYQALVVKKREIESDIKAFIDARKFDWEEHFSVHLLK